MTHSKITLPIIPGCFGKSFDDAAEECMGNKRKRKACDLKANCREVTFKADSIIRELIAAQNEVLVSHGIRPST